MCGEDERRRKLLIEWQYKTSLSKSTHYEHAKHYHHLNRRYLVIPLIALSAIVGTSVFVALENISSSFPRILVASTTVILAVLSALQSGLGLGEASERYRTTATLFSGLEKHIQVLLADNVVTQESLIETEKKYSEIVSSAPPTKTKIYDVIKQRVDSENNKTKH